jgi:hypothetical protein
VLKQSRQQGQAYLNKIKPALAATAVYFFGDKYVHPINLLKTLSTLHYSQCGRVENFLLNEILGIKKYFLAHSSAAKMKTIKQKPREGLCCYYLLFIISSSNLPASIPLSRCFTTSVFRCRLLLPKKVDRCMPPSAPK